MDSKNIVLIGMPSSGKSTIGQHLSKMLGIPFIDTDTEISKIAGKSPREIVGEEGLDVFLNLQEKVALSLDIQGSVISTGGGIIYSKASMNHLRKNGIVFFLKTDVRDVEARVDPSRHLARREGQNLQDIYRERLPLYEKYADITIDCSGKSETQIAEEIIGKLKIHAQG